MLRGGFVLIDSDSGAVARAFEFQYHPAVLRRTFAGPRVAHETDVPTHDLGHAPPRGETIRLDLELDATDRVESEERFGSELGVTPRLAALESIAYPGTAVAAPLTVFVWGSTRIVPVQVVELDILEEAFDTSLNPIRATVAVTMNVLGEPDLTGRGRRLHRAYERKKEELASLGQGSLSKLADRTLAH